MVIVDRELEAREKIGKPIRIALIGAGNMGRSVALQLLTPVRGMRLVAIANRTIEAAERAFHEGGMQKCVRISTASELDNVVARGECAVTGDARAVCRAENIDAIIEVTGSVEFGATVVMDAINHKKHVVLVNAELDSTLGPVLKRHADNANVVITNVDGDEPGVAMNLLRYLKSIGLRPVAAGNLKGMIDPYRTPETQREFAAKHSQNPAIVTSFADGTKLCMESAILANASGFKVGKPGMYGPKCGHVKEMATKLPLEQVLDGGLVDYALGAEPGTGAFVIVHEEHPVKKKHLAYLKMGDGPLYVFYTPFHLPHLQLASSVARAVLLRDATTSPLGYQATCEVFAVAKRDLTEGEMLDGVGGFMTYGVIDNSPAVRSKDLLPMGLSQGYRVKRAIRKDQPLTFSDVAIESNRLCDRLYLEQRVIG
ncbi:MAG TPA: NAD(P)-dependent oxidoreductase [Bacteroidetes bacterium]|jgi:predicted homoserine dehydrogenase-like protein|nr:NAD(P)-dependent oxidoreductase [Bacteroidota bacterium]